MKSFKEFKAELQEKNIQEFSGNPTNQPVAKYKPNKPPVAATNSSLVSGSKDLKSYKGPSPIKDIGGHSTASKSLPSAAPKSAAPKTTLGSQLKRLGPVAAGIAGYEAGKRSDSLTTSTGAGAALGGLAGAAAGGLGHLAGRAVAHKPNVDSRIKDIEGKSVTDPTSKAYVKPSASKSLPSVSLGKDPMALTNLNKPNVLKDPNLKPITFQKSTETAPKADMTKKPYDANITPKTKVKSAATPTTTKPSTPSMFDNPAFKADAAAGRKLSTTKSVFDDPAFKKDAAAGRDLVNKPAETSKPVSKVGMSSSDIHKGIADLSSQNPETKAATKTLSSIK